MKDSPVLVLPADPELERRLRLKLKEYESRIDHYRHPALQIDDLCKFAVLTRLLQEGTVVTFELSREIVGQYGSTIQVAEAFNNACAVIQAYITDGGTSLRSGTGLPRA